MSSQERLSLIEYSKTIPLTKKAINTFIKLGFYTKDELEEENRKLYAEKNENNTYKEKDLIKFDIICAFEYNIIAQIISCLFTSF